MGKKVYQYSISRSGSTVVWQILNYLFPKPPVGKRHTPPREPLDGTVVITMRDPRDRLASKWRKLHRSPDKQLQSKQQVVRLLADQALKFKELKNFLDRVDRHSVLLLSYESFYDNFDYLFERIGSFFHVEISQEQQQYIRDNFNVQRNLELSQKLPNFHKIDYASKIHGNHISPVYKGRPGCWRQVIHPSLHKFIMKELKPQIDYQQRLLA